MLLLAPFGRSAATTIKIPFNLFVHPCFLLYFLLCHLHPLLIGFYRLFFRFTRLGALGTRGFFWRTTKSFVGSRRTRLRPKTRASPKPETEHKKPLAPRYRFAGSSHCLNFEKFRYSSSLMTGLGESVALTWSTRYPPPTHP